MRGGEKRSPKRVPPTNGGDRFSADYHVEGAFPSKKNAGRLLTIATAIIGTLLLLGGIVYGAGVLSEKKADREAVTEEITSEVQAHAQGEHPKTADKLERIQEHLHEVEVRQTSIEGEIKLIQNSIESIDEKLGPPRRRRR